MGGYWANLLVLVGINATAAWALGLAVRTGQLSIGHAALMGLGGYAAGWSALQGGAIVVTFVVGVVAVAAIGGLVAFLTLRLNHLFLALSTLVFGQIAVIVVTNTSELGGAVGLVGLPLFDLRPLVVVSVVAVLLVEVLLIRGSRIELHMALVAADSALVEMAGRSSTRFRVAVFTASAAAAGFAGVMHAYYLGVVQPSDLGFIHSLDLLVYVVVGGARSGFGPMLGAAALTLLPEVVGLEGGYSTILLGAVLLATMLLRSDGVVGRIPVRVLRPNRPAAGGGSDALADSEPRTPAVPTSDIV